MGFHALMPPPARYTGAGRRPITAPDTGAPEEAARRSYLIFIRGKLPKIEQPFFGGIFKDVQGIPSIPDKFMSIQGLKWEETTMLREVTQQPVAMGTAEAAHLPEDPETGHVLAGGSPTGGGGQSNSSAQIHKQRMQGNNPRRHAPPALLLVALQTFIIRFGPLRFADRLRFQQSAPQGLWVVMRGAKK